MDRKPLRNKLKNKSSRIRINSIWMSGLVPTTLYTIYLNLHILAHTVNIRNFGVPSSNAMNIPEGLPLLLLRILILPPTLLCTCDFFFSSRKKRLPNSLKSLFITTLEKWDYGRKFFWRSTERSTKYLEIFNKFQDSIFFSFFKIIILIKKNNY